ncbi:MAG TPA: hypothetical protein VFM98_00065 [Ramlibacter sp.]|uniref:hypothetical protein n=1 Tax=Ramlibacter sp. TaxID=1917967 RepID=UPI002D7F40F2|nr:hypothetical protein [Ramlibacter sp.]HET8743968.1 hypothetical protein [Ramlibacter sp.]
MASRTPSNRKPSEGGRATQQKQRASGERERARASGGGLRSQPAEAPPGRSASTGGLTTRGMLRNDANSRSSNAGNQRRQHTRKER